MGLPSGIKWATCNFGAETPNSYGNYYQWGKIYTSSPQGIEHLYNLKGKDIVEFSGNKDYDVAASWRESWRMPTAGEVQELIEQCTWEIVVYKERNGVKVIGENGKSIFLPCAGYYSYSDIVNGGLHYEDRWGYYFTSSLAIDDSECKRARALFIYSQDNIKLNEHYRYIGCPIRAISE